MEWNIWTNKHNTSTIIHRGYIMCKYEIKCFNMFWRVSSSLLCIGPTQHNNLFLRILSPAPSWHIYPFLDHMLIISSAHPLANLASPNVTVARKTPSVRRGWLQFPLQIWNRDKIFFYAVFCNGAFEQTKIPPNHGVCNAVSSPCMDQFRLWIDAWFNSSEHAASSGVSMTPNMAAFPSAPICSILWVPASRMSSNWFCGHDRKRLDSLHSDVADWLRRSSRGEKNA